MDISNKKSLSSYYTGFSKSQKAILKGIANRLLITEKYFFKKSRFLDDIFLSQLLTNRTDGLASGFKEIK